MGSRLGAQQKLSGQVAASAENADEPREVPATGACSRTEEAGEVAVDGDANGTRCAGSRHGEAVSHSSEYEDAVSDSGSEDQHAGDATEGELEELAASSDGGTSDTEYNPEDDMDVQVAADLILDHLVGYEEDDDDDEDDSFDPDDPDDEEGEEVEEEEDDDEYDDDEVLEDDRHDHLEDLSPETAPLDHVLVDETRMKTAPSPFAAWLWKIARDEQGGTKKLNTWHMLTGRQQNLTGRGAFSSAERCQVAHRYLPNGGPDKVDFMRSRAYIGQFSQDGSMFVAGFQDRRIRVYQVDRGWALRKDINCKDLRWTVTDTALSPDQKFLVYSSITPTVHLVGIGPGDNGVESIANVNEIHEPLNFAGTGASRVFGLWSLQFSTDGREIVAGSSDSSLYLYDVEANRPTLKCKAHEDDVNAVAFADDTSNVILSGSDDKLCKVWDRRVLKRDGKKGSPVGVLVGHVEGLTHIDSRGDGRYLITNAKDQCIKLWDMRKMVDAKTHADTPPAQYRQFRWDYRWMDYPGSGKNIRHPHDTSLMTYRGHKVLQTLIRAYFSPAHTTGQRYIYTGSYDGSIFIYDVLTGQVVSKMQYHVAAVRDCSWHPTLPMMTSSSWDGYIARWEPQTGPVGRRVSSIHDHGYDIDTLIDEGDDFN